MHIRSKFDGGKQVNRSQSGSWEGRCAGAALRVNEGPAWGPTCWEKATNTEPSECFKSTYATKGKQVASDYKRKASDDAKLKRKRRKLGDDSLQSRLDYSCYDNKGPNATEIPSDISPANLTNLMIQYYRANVQVTEASAAQININTMGQSSGDNELTWQEERRKRITASSVGQIAKRTTTTKVTSTIKQLLYSTFTGNKATNWGILQEDVSRTEYLKIQQKDSSTFTITSSGLVISIENPWLAASPDGLVFDPQENPPEGLVKFKNPYSVKDKTLEEAASSSKTFCLTLTKSGKLELKRGHDYYFQIQCAMYCTKRNWCDLVVLTKTVHIQRIHADPNFSSNIIPKLKDFYFTAVLPELASQESKIREPEEWVTDDWKETYLQLDP